LSLITCTIQQLQTPADARMGSAAITSGVIDVDGDMFLLANGHTVYRSFAGQWVEGRPVLPISTSQVAMWASDCFLDVDGNGWIVQSNQWVNVGPPPDSQPISLTPTTWSAIKSRFGGHK
jgi:hypothetical protein